MTKGSPRKPSASKKVTRYTHDKTKETRVPETGHTALLPDDEIVTVPMDIGWGKALHLVKHDPDPSKTLVIDMDPAVDPTLLWAGKRCRRQVPVLPLQRTEIVSESRIATIIDRARKAAADKDAADFGTQGSLFASLERTLREKDQSHRVEFYKHEENWRNRLICGDSLHVMESLVRYEHLAGKVQMIFMDPPYGIKYDSNFQQRIDSTRNEDKDRSDDILTIKAFRDTWALGIHSYLSYLQERLYLCRELLADTGSVFLQISDDNVHLVRALLDEVFGAKNHFSTVIFNKTTGFTDQRLSCVYDCFLWYAKDISQVRYNQLYQPKAIGLEGAGVYNKVELPSGERRRLTQQELENIDRLAADWKVYRLDNLNSQGAPKDPQPFKFEGQTYYPAANNHWKTPPDPGLKRLAEKRRIEVSGKSLAYVRYYQDFPVSPISNVWLDVGTGSFTEPKVYAVQTGSKAVLRCIAMATNPGDLVFDPTCGSGTTATCAERLGRRWITCDTSRVAVNVARQRLLSSIFEHYRTRNGHVGGGFVYKSVTRTTLKSLAYDMEPERVDLVDQPEVDKDAIRVTGPFDVMSVGRYSVEDWKGYVLRDGADPDQQGMLEDYIGVICRLYRPDAAVQGAAGFIHAIAESSKQKIGISVGPLSGRVTAKQVNDAVQDGLASGLLEVHVLGWAFEANVGEVKSRLEAPGKVKVELIMIRPDTLAEGLKVTRSESLFSPLALPEIEVQTKKSKAGSEFLVSLKGVAFFDRKNRRTEYKPADSGYIAAWYLDEDYDGDCFVDCQMFFDFNKDPNLKSSLNLDIDPDEYRLQLTSRPFPVRNHKRVAVKVVDVYGNESTLVRSLS